MFRVLKTRNFILMFLADVFDRPCCDVIPSLTYEDAVDKKRYVDDVLTTLPQKRSGLVDNVVDVPYWI